MPFFKLPSFLRLKKQEKPKTIPVKKLFGKERELQKQVQDMVDGRKKDSWIKKGTVDRYSSVLDGKLDLDPHFFLKQLGKKNPQVLFGGVSRGEYITPFRDKLRKEKINPKIDVFNLTKMVSKNRNIRSDLSIGQALETIASNPEKYSAQIGRMKEKYDLAIFSSGAGIHTLYPAFNVFNIALMLKPKGRAYVEIPTKRFIEEQSINNNETYPVSQVKRIQTQVENIEEIVQKMLNAYYKKDVSSEYNIMVLGKSKSRNGVFVRITRK